MQMIIRKWGNSLAARIPRAIAESSNLHLDQTVDIEAVDGKIVITPLPVKKEYKLDDLLRQCKAETMRIDREDREWLNNEPVGREVW